MLEPSLTVGLFGSDAEFVRQLGSAIGKRGTESDLRFWNKKEGDLALTAIAPITYPERLVPLLQTAGMCDFPVLVAGRLDAAFGETAIALGAARKRGLLILRDMALAEKVHAIARERLRGWVTMEWSGEESLRRFRALLPGIEIPRDVTSPARVVLDHAFDVRGVGAVALGFVRSGILRVHDEPRLLPSDTRVTVRSIQRFDEDQEAAPAGSRVGLALKGVEAHEIERGSILTLDPGDTAGTRLTLSPFAREPFFREPLAPGARGYHVLAGLFPRPVVLEAVGDTLQATADRPVPWAAGDFACLAALQGPGRLRIAGHGLLARP